MAEIEDQHPSIDDKTNEATREAPIFYSPPTAAKWVESHGCINSQESWTGVFLCALTCGGGGKQGREE